jgi:succinate dehydrogenase/fumarate reductase cytochrome b subunit
VIATFGKSLLALIPASALFAGALALFLKGKGTSSWLQLLGSASLVLVVLAHVCEGLRLFPTMGWGLEHSAGHYLDLCSAVLALTLFPIGYLLHALLGRQT